MVFSSYLNSFTDGGYRVQYKAEYPLHPVPLGKRKRIVKEGMGFFKELFPLFYLITGKSPHSSDPSQQGREVRCRVKHRLTRRLMVNNDESF